MSMGGLFTRVGGGEVMDPPFTPTPGRKRTINIPLSASSANERKHGGVKRKFGSLFFFCFYIRGEIVHRAVWIPHLHKATLVSLSLSGEPAANLSLPLTHLFGGRETNGIYSA